MTEPTNNEPYLKPCHVCGATMHLHYRKRQENERTRDWYYVDGRHDVDCPFNIHFRPTRYPTPDTAVNEWNGRPIK